MLQPAGVVSVDKLAVNASINWTAGSGKRCNASYRFCCAALRGVKLNQESKTDEFLFLDV
jgi:hypothetical protein